MMILHFSYIQFPIPTLDNLKEYFQNLLVWDVTQTYHNDQVRQGSISSCTEQRGLLFSLQSINVMSDWRVFKVNCTQLCAWGRRLGDHSLYVGICDLSLSVVCILMARRRNPYISVYMSSVTHYKEGCIQGLHDRFPLIFLRILTTSANLLWRQDDKGERDAYCNFT